MNAVAVVLVLAGCSAEGTSSGASCAAPQVTVSPATAGAGETVRVRGRFFIDGCNDTGQDDPTPPMTGLRVTFTPEGGAAAPLGQVDATGDLGVFDIPLTIPKDTTPGAARVTVGETTPAELTIS